jgi:signal transduction histidine kinase
VTVNGISPTHPDETITLIEREKIRLAFGSWVSYVDGTPFALLLLFLFCGTFPTLGSTSIVAGMIWLGFVLTWAIGSSLGYQYYKRNASLFEPSVWRIQLAATWITHAFIWAATLFVFWDHSNTINQAILCTIALGVIVSYFFNLTMYLPVMLSALGTLSVTQSLAFAYHGSPMAHVFLVIFPMFVCVLMNYGLKAARSYHVALQLRFENEALAAAVTRANQAKSSFLASMSHELRTPLNAIIGYSDLMRHQTFGPIAPTRYATYVEDIHTSGEHLLKMINDLLDLAKIEAGKRELDYTSVKLTDLVKEAIRFIEPQAQRAHIGILTDLKADAIVYADERSLKQILINLLSNAVKFSRPSGIAVVFSKQLPGGGIALGVKDTGIGMSSEMIVRALVPFEQGSDSYTVEGRGTGLGLPICKGLVEAHQGQIKLESTQGVGSKIWIELPAARVMRETAAA